MIVQMIREKGGAAVKLSQSNWVGRALATYLPSQVIIATITMTMTTMNLMIPWNMHLVENLPAHSGHHCHNHHEDDDDYEYDDPTYLGTCIYLRNLPAHSGHHCDDEE